MDKLQRRVHIRAADRGFACASYGLIRGKENRQSLVIVQLTVIKYQISNDARGAGRGRPPRRLRTAPLHRGDEDGELDEGYENRRSPPPTSNPYPLLGGVPPAGGGVVPPQGAPPSKPSSLIFDI
ncbi:MAG: hypothetical protein LBM98_02205 [Oscillospiraceae bacterium]|nr:hypothetical protein [Oscillospiraceae bacterium]